MAEHVSYSLSAWHTGGLSGEALPLFFSEILYVTMMPPAWGLLGALEFLASGIHAETSAISQMFSDVCKL